MPRFLAICSLILASRCAVADDAPQPSPVVPAVANAETAARRFFDRNDTDKNGKLTRSEFPARVRNLFDRIDTNQDQAITLAEDIAYRQRRGSSRDQQALPKNTRAIRDVEYARVGDTRLLLDLYLPSDPRGKLPLVVWVHGGGWKQGDKARCPALRLVRRGYAVASLNYRLSQQAIFPAQIEDCKAAIRWLRAHADDHHIHPERIGVWGSSAGGHLVALLGTSGDVKSLEGTLGNADESSRVQAVVDFFGPTDFLQMDTHALPTAPFAHNAADSPESQLVGRQITQVPEKVAAANPITYVSKDDPPFLIVHGDRDRLVPHHQSEILVAALKEAGVDVTFHTVEGAGHGFGNRVELDRMVDTFFDKQLRPAQK